MALCKLTPQEFIKEVFSPIIAVHCSSEVDQICGHNNLTFVELIQPFCKLNVETTIHDPTNNTSVIRNLRIILKNMNSQPPSLPVGKKMTNDAVTYNQLPDNPHYVNLTHGQYNLNICPTTPWFEAFRDVFFYITYPTDHEFTHHFLGCIFVVAASNNDPLLQLEELIQQQVAHQQQGLNNMHKWLLPNIFRYFVLLHDNSKDDLNKSEMNLQKVKNKYGGNCFLLEINSLLNEPNKVNLNNIDPWAQFINKINIPNSSSVIDLKLPDHGVFYKHSDSSSELSSEKSEIFSTIDHPLSLSTESIATPSLNLSLEDSLKNNVKDNMHKIHGQYLSTSDIENIHSFVSEFIIHGLLPYVEKNLRILNEQIPNKKSIHRSIFNATKKWLGAGSSKVGQSGQPTSTSVVYAQDAAELQVRKLGDLSFMFQMYELAFQCYHSAKRDFEIEQAWLYFAGALEMAALSLFMLGGTTQAQYRTDYMEKAIMTYLNTCKSPQFATRATLLSTECLKSKGMYNEAALQFIRMTSEDSDLRSALLLEQAAHCFINTKTPLVRKFAFHIVLAGHRFSKAGQKKHSLRAYKSAFQIYQGTFWNLAEDHINFTIGRHSLYLKLLDEACESFQNLLTRKSFQNPAQQSTFLREYLVVLKTLCMNKPSLPNFPIPIVLAQQTRVLFGSEHLDHEPKRNKFHVNGRSFASDYSEPVWLKLEELALSAAVGSPQMVNQPQTYLLSQKTNNSSIPLAVISEYISVELHLQNPLQIPLILANLFLLWDFHIEESGQILSNEDPHKKIHPEISTHVISEVTIEPGQVSKLILSLQPLKTGKLHIKGLSYTLCFNSCLPNIVNGDTDEKSNFNVTGKQEFSVRGKRLNNTKNEKVNKIYGPDYRLKPLVIPPMPKLDVGISDYSDVLFCGEVRKINVEFKNVGNEDLHRIFVASSAPELFFFGCNQEYDDYWLPYREVPHDPTSKIAPMLAEPLAHNYTSEILFSNGNPIFLPPGETFTIPLYLRGPDSPGEHTLNLLFYYETAKTNSKLPYRVIQHSLIINTLPSLSVKAELLWSNSYTGANNANSIILKMEVQNIGDICSTEISALQVSSLGDKWHIAPLNTITRQGAISIQPHESLHLAFKAVPFDHKPSKKMVVLSQVPFGHSSIDCSSSPCIDFTWYAHNKLPGIDGIALPKRPSEGEPLQATQITPISKFYEALKASQSISISFTLIWKCVVERYGQNQVVMGQHHLTFEKLETLVSTLPSVPKQPECPLQPLQIISWKEEVAQDNYLDVNLLNKAVACHLDHPPLIIHDFSKEKLCFVPISLKVVNFCSVSLWVSIEINYEAQSLSKPASPLASPVSPDEINLGFSWSGPTCQQACVNSLDLASFPFVACFSYPGTYLLGYLQVRVSPAKDSALFWNQALPPCLIVIASSS